MYVCSIPIIKSGSFGSIFVYSKINKAMAKSAHELDFFGMEKESKLIPSAAKPPIFERRRSFRDIQGVISKIKPEVLKSVIATGCFQGGNKSSSVSAPSTPKETIVNFPPLPVWDPTLGLSCWYGKNAETAPMTIFYDGKVAVFDVSPHKAQDIFKVAEDGLQKSANFSDSKATENSFDREYLLDNLNGDLPIARRKSLQRFLEKRKERLTMGSPYGFPTDYSYSSKSVSARKEV